MNATWIPIGTAVGILLLSLAVLEVMSERVGVDRSFTGAGTVWETPAHSDDVLPLELAASDGRETGSGER